MSFGMFCLICSGCLQNDKMAKFSSKLIVGLFLAELCNLLINLRQIYVKTVQNHFDIVVQNYGILEYSVVAILYKVLFY